MRKNSCELSQNVVAEARNISGFLVEIERGKCGGDVDVAIHRVAAIYGVDEESVRSLRYRWRDMQDVKASLLERLREAYESVYEHQRRQAVHEQALDDFISRGGAGGAQGEGVAVRASSPSPSSRDTLSRAYALPAKQPRNRMAELHMEKET